MLSSSIADHYNNLTSRIMCPFSECFREAKNINSILPNELLVRIFNFVDEVPRSAQKSGTKTSLALPMRLTCRRLNKLLSNSSNRSKLARIRRIPIGVMRITQLDKSYGIFMIDSTDDEFITRIMKGKDYYWRSEDNNDNVIPTIRTIEFDESGVAMSRTFKMDSEVWRILGVRSYQMEYIVPKLTSEFLFKFNDLLDRYAPQLLILEHIRFTRSFVLSITEILERYQRIPRLSVGLNRVKTDVTGEDLQRLFMNTLDLTGLAHWYTTKEFFENILATWTETDLKLDLHPEPSTISLNNFEKVTYVRGLKTTLDDLFEAIEKRVKISNEIEWHATVNCNFYIANARILEKYRGDFDEIENDPEDICKNNHHIFCNGVEILIKLRSTGYDHTSSLCVKTAPKQAPQPSRWMTMKNQLTAILPYF